VICIDLLKSDVYAEFASRPIILRERYAIQSGHAQRPIVIDDIQKCPELLDEIHWLIENCGQTFLLTGSSARKLRRQHSNLLGGRAWRREMRPLCWPEVENYDPIRAINHGLIPSHYNSEHPREELRAYLADYLRDEIAIEAAVRNLPAFSEFLRVAAITNAELLNYSNVSREVGVSAKIVRSYFEILEETLLGFRIAPWRKSNHRRLIETEKFYLFDTGVANFLAKRTVATATPEFGKSFEHLILMELLAFKAYYEPEMDITFWLTSNKQEVDFVINDKAIAIEVKAASKVGPWDTKNMTILSEDGPIGKRIIISMDPIKRVIKDSFGEIEIIPWQEFLSRLWSKEFKTS